MTNGSNQRTTSALACYWIGTISCDEPWVPCLPDGVQYLKGQKEEGEGGFQHWQIYFKFSRNCRLGNVRRTFAPTIGHWEPTRSVAAEAYVWKEDTRIGEQFEFGSKPINRASRTDWVVVKENAKAGNLDIIPADIFVRYYRTLQSIASDNSKPGPRSTKTIVFFGPTGTGKSHRAWAEAGTDAYAKDPRSKFWCGYVDQINVIIDEFRGGIDIAHILRWTDKYPVTVEIKGSSKPLRATSFYITSNLHPSQWYPELDGRTVEALLRRLELIEMTETYVEPESELSDYSQNE